MAEKKLEVKNLTISFKTDNGLVQAVRNVSFDLDEEETLCIVGESGSGKSVTSKAIMGILANNAVVEGGEILYEGENLLEVSEEEYHKIRGNKIGMIFQDPLSSLNPIVRIGKQITEAMLINSDKVKKMYEEKISKELIAYKNVIARRNIKVKKAKDEFVLTLKRAQKDNATKETLAKIKKEAAATRKAKIADAEKECNNALPPLKKALDEKKAQAKKEVNEYKKSVKDAYKPIRKENTSKILSALKSRNKEEIKQAKEKYIKDRDAYLDQLKITKKEAKRRAIEIMGEVGIPLPEKRFRQYPFEFSGGMRQRIVIAIALTAAPEILICDEPTTALDVTIQAQILELIKKIQKERHISCIFITHDLGVVANMADRVAVMYAGKIVECGTAEEIFYDPKHPYTWALLASIPDIDSKERLEAIPGTPPDMIYPPKGDAFALRSKYAMKIDFEQEPPMFKISDTHYAATWLLHPDAPKVKMPKIVETRIKNALKESKANKKKEGAPNDGE
ncbi:MAG: ATP-binding cassette domain-containing protein [Erysipelotrichaceae bacterium]|nr:ATP-binding cassette domain-containing protein [Erysipelotrichaceae bacterium]